MNFFEFIIDEFFFFFQETSMNFLFSGDIDEFFFFPC